MEPIIIKGNLICRESILHNTLLVIRDGIIESIQNNNFIGATIIDFGNSYIIPGLIDIHCDVIEKDVLHILVLIVNYYSLKILLLLVKRIFPMNGLMKITLNKRIH